jgi:hypothetical protein
MRKVPAGGYAERCGNALNPLGQRDRDARAQGLFQRVIDRANITFGTFYEDSSNHG